MGVFSHEGVISAMAVSMTCPKALVRMTTGQRHTELLVKSCAVGLN
jgi:hypothetical protein